MKTSKEKQCSCCFCRYQRQIKAEQRRTTERFMKSPETDNHPDQESVEGSNVED